MALLRTEKRQRTVGGRRNADRGHDPPGGDPHALTATDWETIVEGFLANRPDAVGIVRSWAEGIARHRAWGFDSPEDIVQDAMLVLTRVFRAGGFVPGDLRAYVRRIVKNLCVSSYRKSIVRGRSVDPGVDRPELVAEESAERMASGAMARRILERMDEPCRRIVVLAYIKGLGRKEIAEALGISETAAKVRIFRCIEKARQGGAGDRADGRIPS
jgi:RNA polymerase sigma-70 factor (ECF subfamily)